MKRFLACLLLLCLLIGAWAVSEEDKKVPALDISLSAAEKLVRLISMEDYVRLFAPPGEIEQLLKNYGGDWAKEENLAGSRMIYVPKILFSAVLSAYLLGTDSSVELNQYGDYLMRMMAALPVSTVNSGAGVTALAASSLARYSEVRYLPDMLPGVTYVLLDYGREHPYILVTFIVSDDQAATVEAALLMLDHEKAEDFIRQFTTLKGLKEMIFSN